MKDKDGGTKLQELKENLPTFMSSISHLRVQTNCSIILNWDYTIRELHFIWRLDSIQNVKCKSISHYCKKLVGKAYHELYIP